MYGSISSSLPDKTESEPRIPFKLLTLSKAEEERHENNGTCLRIFPLSQYLIHPIIFKYNIIMHTTI